MNGFSFLILILLFFNTILFYISFINTSNIYTFLHSINFIACTVAYVLIISIYYIAQKILEDIENKERW